MLTLYFFNRIKYIAVILVFSFVIVSCKLNINGGYVSKKNNITNDDNKAIIFLGDLVGSIFEYGYSEIGSESFKCEFDYSVNNDTIFIEAFDIINSNCNYFELDSTYFVRKGRKLIHYPSKSSFIYKKYLTPWKLYAIKNYGTVTNYKLTISFKDSTLINLKRPKDKKVYFVGPMNYSETFD